MNRCVLALTAAAGWAAAQDLAPRDVPGEGAAQVEFAPARDVHGWAPDDSPVLVASLREIHVTGSESGAPAVRRPAVTLQGMTVDALDGLAAELAEWLGRPLTALGLDRLTEVILRHYEDHDRPVNEVAVPPQDATGGILRVQVFEGRVGQVGVERTRHFKDSLLERAITIREGNLLEGSAVQADLDWLSRNPFRRAELFAAPGEGVSADLLVRIAERRPWRVYAGYDNSGSEAVGENRWFAGFNWGNAFHADHVAGYQFTTGNSIDDFAAHAATWEIPLHRRHQFVQLAAGWARARSDEPVEEVITNSEGTSWQASLMFGTLVPIAPGWKHEARAGIEFKHADNFFTFGETTLPGTEVDLFQLRGDWTAERRLDHSTLRLDARLVASPGGLTDDNGDDAFEAFRTGANPAYLYGRAGAAWESRHNEGWNWRLRGEAQLASGALLPTEQLALGGHDTVRGYSERILLADSGYALSAELLTPAVRRDLPAVGSSSLHGVLFLEHGLGWREGDGFESLTGAGAGLRLRLGSTAEARLDAAIPLEGDHDPRLHAGVFLAF